MLIDRTTKKTYSCGVAARRELGTLAFNKKVKNNELEFIQCKFAE